MSPMHKQLLQTPGKIVTNWLLVAAKNLVVPVPIELAFYLLPGCIERMEQVYGRDVLVKISKQSGTDREVLITPPGMGWAVHCPSSQGANDWFALWLTFRFPFFFFNFRLRNFGRTVCELWNSIFYK